jgi:hypothetical protein
MKLKLILITLFGMNLLSAQKFYFPKISVSDSVILEKNVSGIAAKIVSGYKQPTKPDSLEKQFKLEILTGNYKKSVVTIEKYREAFANKNFASTKFINYEIYAIAKDIEQNEKTTFSDALNKAFEIKYKNLPDKYAFRIGDVFVENVSDQRVKLTKSLTALKNDSRSNASAMAICLNYLDYKTTSSIQSTVVNLLALKDEQKYSVESIDLKTKNGGTVTLTITRSKINNQPLPVILTNNIYAGSYDKALGKRAVAYN